MTHDALTDLHRDPNKKMSEAQQMLDPDYLDLTFAERERQREFVELHNDPDELLTEDDL